MFQQLNFIRHSGDGDDEPRFPEGLAERLRRAEAEVEELRRLPRQGEGDGIHFNGRNGRSIDLSSHKKAPFLQTHPTHFDPTLKQIDERWTRDGMIFMICQAATDTRDWKQSSECGMICRLRLHLHVNLTISYSRLFGPALQQLSIVFDLWRKGYLELFGSIHINVWLCDRCWLKTRKVRVSS